jgi:amino acid transporter
MGIGAKDPRVAPLSEVGVVHTELKEGELGLFDSVAVATASVAPAYSLTSTIAFVVAIGGIGFGAPSILLVSFVAVLTIAFAYYFMNRKDPNCGASYSWLARTVSPYFGWFNGWVQVLASTLFCASAPILAGANTLAFLNNIGWISAKAANSVYWQAGIGLIWLVIITAMCVYGIRLTTDFQWVLVAIEYTAVIAFSVFAILDVIASHPTGSLSFSWGWLNPFSIKGISALAAGLVLGVFFFWGWDTAANLNEETKDANETPGRAGVISMFLLLVVFVLAAIAIQMRVPQKTIVNQGGSVLYYFAHSISPSLSVIMLLAILSSTVATAQTTLLPAARITYSMARDKVFPSLFGKISARFKTPAEGTIVLAVLSAIVIGITTFSSSANTVFGKLITDIGILVAFYYGVTGLSCAWAFRKVLTRSVGIFLLAGLFPAVGGAVLLWVGYEVIVTGGTSVAVPTLVVMAAGIPLVIVARLINKTGYFQQKTVAYESR